MATEEITFSMDLEGGLARTALSDADALEQLKASITAGTDELREMQKAYRNLKGSATANVETVKALKDRISASKATLAGNTEKLVGMKGAFEKIPRPAEATRSALDRVFNGADNGKGPLASLVDKLSSMKTILGSGVIAAGLVAVAAGMAALAAACVVATAALVGYAIAAADARRSDTLRLEGLSKHRNYWLEMVTGQRRAADSASFLQASIDRVSAASPLARDRISEMTGELYKSGLRAGNLQAALEGMAIVEATQGQEAAAAFKARAMGAHLYGTSIKKLSDDVKNRLGGIAKAHMLSLGVQQRKLKENLDLLFKDVKIEPFLRAVAVLTNNLSQSTASGRALKALVDVLLQPLINAAKFAGPLLQAMFEGFIIAALQFTIVILKVRNYLRDTFGGSQFLKGMDLQKAALYTGIALFGALATVVIVTFGAFALLAGIVAAVGYGLYKLAEPFVFVMGKGAELAAWVLKTDWHVLGTMITGGIAAGIKAGAGAVWDAMRNMGSGAIKAFKDKLGIKSPSKVAFAASLEVPHGSRNALEAGRPMVRRSAERLGAAVEAGLRDGTERTSTGGDSVAPRAAAGGVGVPAGAGAPRAAAPSMSFTFGDIVVPGGAGQSPEQLKAAMREVLEQMLEGAAIHVGAM
jgi:hypothetical protein